MKLRRWQQKVIDEFPDIVKNYKKFILKATAISFKTCLLTARRCSVVFTKTKKS